MSKTSKIISSALLASIALTACQTQFNSPLVAQRNSSPSFNNYSNYTSYSNPLTGKHVSGQMIVKFRKNASFASVQGTLKAHSLRHLKSIGRTEFGINLVKIESDKSLAQTIVDVRKDPNVLYAEPNGIVSLPRLSHRAVPGFRASKAAYPNDKMFERQYSHYMTSSQEGWKINKGSEDVVLAVVDTGIDTGHPDLKDKLVPGYDTIDNDTNPHDGQGHGTHCAGIAAAIADNKIGVAGYAPNVKVMPVRVLNNYGSGTWESVANGIIWAAENKADVISMSLGGPSNSEAVADAVKLALEKDSVVIAAMGNDGDETKSYPAAVPGVIAVGATDSLDRKARFSQYGDWISVSAPGVDILSTFPTYRTQMPGKKYGSISGTSMATPAVAGVAALIRSQWPEMDHLQVRAQLEQGVDDLGPKGFDKYYGHGRINVKKALTPVDGRVQSLRRARRR